MQLLNTCYVPGVGLTQQLWLGGVKWLTICVIIIFILKGNQTPTINWWVHQPFSLRSEKDIHTAVPAMHS